MKNFYPSVAATMRSMPARSQIITGGDSHANVTVILPRLLHPMAAPYNTNSVIKPFMQKRGCV